MPVPPPEAAAPRWRRLVRSPRGAAGLAIVAAALLLWPFANWSVIPWLVGIGVLVVLRLLRLDGLLRGWALHVGGVVVVAGLMYSTRPWAWALAASIGVLLAGLVMLPRWKVAAVGGALCLVTGVGFGIDTYRAHVEAEQNYQRGGDLTRSQIPEARTDILPALIQSVDSAVPDPQPLCRLAAPEAVTQLGHAFNVQDCPAAVSVMFQRRQAAGVPDNAGTASWPKATPDPDEQRMTINACSTVWAQAAGTQLGRIHITMVNPADRLYAVSGFSAC